MSLEECRIIEIPSFSDSRGDLCVLEKGDVLPFEIKRIFYTYNVPPSESRGAHAHKKCHQFLIAVSGAVRVIAEDGRSRKEFCLDEPTRGVLLPAGVWGIQYGHTPGAVLLVLASERYDAADYIRRYEDYMAYVNAQ